MGGAGFFGGLLGGFGDEMLTREAREHGERLLDLANRRRAVQVLIESPNLEPKVKLAGFRALVASQEPTTRRGKRGGKQVPGPLDMFMDLLGEMPAETTPALTTPAVPARDMPPSPTTGQVSPGGLTELPLRLPALPSVQVAPRREGVFTSEQEQTQRQVEKARAQIPVAVESARQVTRAQGEEHRAGVSQDIDRMRLDFTQTFGREPKEKELEAIYGAAWKAPLVPKPSTRTFQRWYTDPSSSTGFSVDVMDATGNILSTSSNSLPPTGYLPTKTTAVLRYEDQAGVVHFQAVPMVSGKVIPGARTAAPAGPPTPPAGPGGKPAAKGGGLPPLPGRSLGVGVSPRASGGIIKAFQTWQGAEARYTLMQESAREGATDPTGASDMVLASEHINMVFGYTPRTRLSYPLIMEHFNSRSWPDDVRVAIQRVLSGDRLSPDQRRMFVNLARQRVQQLKSEYDAVNERVSQALGGAGASPAEPQPLTTVPKRGKPQLWE